MTNPVATIGNSIPTPSDPSVIRKTYSQILFQEEIFLTYADGEFDPSYTTYDPTNQGKRFFIFVPLDDVLGANKPQFVSQSSWDETVKKAASGFITGRYSIMPKLFIPSLELVDNGVVTDGVGGTRPYAAYVDPATNVEAFNWTALTVNAVAINEKEIVKYIQSAGLFGSQYISVRAKDDAVNTTTFAMDIDPPPQVGGVAPTSGTEGWSTSHELVVDGAFVLMLNIIPSRPGKVSQSDVQENSWSIRFEFQDVIMELNSTGGMKVGYTSGTDRQNNETTVNLSEGKTKEGPPQQEHIEGKQPYIIVVYPVWNGIIVMALRLEGSFEHGKWFEVEFRIDFNKNAWEGIIDGQCLGIFTNDAGLNSVGSIDFFPVNSGNPSSNASVYFIDDVSYEASLDGLEEVELDASISDITLNSRALTGTDVQIGGVLRNNGSNNITSFEVMFDGGGTQFTESFDNLDIASNSTYEFTTSETYTYEEGMNDLSLSLVSVNGQADEKTCNDVRQTTAQGITPAPGKRVLSEEATGTWCGWCPRGEVFIGIMEDRYDDYFVPIAVHQGDPMENDHIGYITSVIPGFAGYPNMVIDRMDWFGFGTVESIENFFFEDIDDAPVGTMDVGAEWDGRTLKVSNALNFDQDSESGMALEVILVENNVTGTGPGYAQINYYAGGGRGPMGGYENLPSPVPADQMVYNHVSRGSFSGHANHSIDGNYTGGDRYLANFAMNVPDTYDDSELLLVALVLNADGSVNNVTEVSLQEAIDNGFEMTTSSDDIQVINDLNVYPNPALNSTFVELDLAEGTNVRIDVINSLGGIVASRDYGKISGSYTFPVDLGNMNAGVYQIQIWVNDEFTTRSLNVIK